MMRAPFMMQGSGAARARDLARGHARRFLFWTWKGSCFACFASLGLRPWICLLDCAAAREREPLSRCNPFGTRRRPPMWLPLFASPCLTVCAVLFCLALPCATVAGLAPRAAQLVSAFTLLPGLTFLQLRTSLLLLLLQLNPCLVLFFVPP